MESLAVNIIPVQGGNLSAVDTQAAGDAVGLPQGWLVAVGCEPYSPTSGFRAAVRGKVELILPDGTVFGTVWEGYIRSAGQPISTPNCYIPMGWKAKLTAASSSALSVFGRPMARCVVTDVEPKGAGSIFREAEGPVASQGDQRQVNLGDPAAGADYGLQTVGAHTLERVDGASSANNTTDAGGSARIYTFRATNGTNVDVMVPGEAYQAASNNGFLSAARGTAIPSVTSAGLDGGDRGINLPDIVLPPGAKWQFVLRNLAAGDNLGQAYARASNWAVIT